MPTRCGSTGISQQGADGIWSLALKGYLLLYRPIPSPPGEDIVRSVSCHILVEWGRSLSRPHTRHTERARLWSILVCEGLAPHAWSHRTAGASTHACRACHIRSRSSAGGSSTCQVFFFLGADRVSRCESNMRRAFYSLNVALGEDWRPLDASTAWSWGPASHDAPPPPQRLYKREAEGRRRRVWRELLSPPGLLVL